MNVAKVVALIILLMQVESPCFGKTDLSQRIVHLAHEVADLVVSLEKELERSTFGISDESEYESSASEHDRWHLLREKYHTDFDQIGNELAELLKDAAQVHLPARIPPPISSSHVTNMYVVSPLFGVSGAFTAGYIVLMHGPSGFWMSAVAKGLLIPPSALAGGAVGVLTGAAIATILTDFSLYVSSLVTASQSESPKNATMEIAQELAFQFVRTLSTRGIELDPREPHQSTAMIAQSKIGVALAAAGQRLGKGDNRCSNTFSDRSLQAN